MNITDSIPGFPGVTILAIAEAVVKILEDKSSDDSILVDTKEAARLLSISKQSVYARVKEGKLTPVKMGKKFLYHKAEVLALAHQLPYQAAA